MKYFSQYRIHDLFELQESLSGLSKSNRWVKLAGRLPGENGAFPPTRNGCIHSLSMWEMG